MDKSCLLITTFNRGNLLKNSLERLKKLTLPDEILIIDDGSSDNTKEICDSFINDLPIRYIYNHNPEWSICSFARNIGIKNTNCEIVITCEPECLGVTDFIFQMIDKHKNMPNNIISAGTIYHGGINSVTTQELIDNPKKVLNNSDLLTNSPNVHGPKNPKGYAKIQGWVATYSALYRKDWLLNIGGWDEQFIYWGHDDTDVLTRLQSIGKIQIIDKDIELVHQYHTKIPSNIQYQGVIANEKLMTSKNFNINDINNDVVANKNKEWGIIKIR